MKRNAIVKPIEATVDFIAGAYNLPRWTQYQLIGDGEILASKSGRRTLINVASVEAYIERKRVKTFPNREEMRRRRLARRSSTRVATTSGEAA